jgi:hypothetical protein
MSAFGVALKEFYCCGKLKSTSLVLADAREEKCGMGDKQDGCCKTTFQYFKVNDSHVAADDIVTPYVPFTDLQTAFTSLQLFSFSINQIDVINGDHAPPLTRDFPVYIFNCVFRI